MPALQPPSMQIGGLPMGASTLSPQPGGPALADAFNEGYPTLVQQVATATTTLGPTGLTITVASTKAGNDLVVHVAAAVNGAGIYSCTFPAGWQTARAANCNGAFTLGGQSMFYPSNPGGITSIAITGFSRVNAMAVWFAEFANTGGALDAAWNQRNLSNGATTISSGTPYNPLIAPTLLVGFEWDVTGQAYTPANSPLSGVPAWVAGTTATSTTGTTNVVIRPFYVITLPNLIQSAAGYSISGNLAGSIACGSAGFSILAATTGTIGMPAPELATTGIVGGGLGNTKPGGAGGGQ